MSKHLSLSPINLLAVLNNHAIVGKMYKILKRRVVTINNERHTRTARGQAVTRDMMEGYGGGANV
jgi:hypothetical protein